VGEGADGLDPMRFAAGGSRSEAGGSLNQLARTSLVVGGTVAAVSVLRRVLKARTRYPPWEKVPYGEFPHKVLIVGGGFAGYMAAKTLCELTEYRDQVPQSTHHSACHLIFRNRRYLTSLRGNGAITSGLARCSSPRGAQ